MAFGRNSSEHALNWFSSQYQWSDKVAREEHCGVLISPASNGITLCAWAPAILNSCYTSGPISKWRLKMHFGQFLPLIFYKLLSQRNMTRCSRWLGVLQGCQLLALSDQLIRYQQRTSGLQGALLLSILSSLSYPFQFLLYSRQIYLPSLTFQQQSLYIYYSIYTVAETVGVLGAIDASYQLVGLGSCSFGDALRRRDD